MTRQRVAWRFQAIIALVAGLATVSNANPRDSAEEQPAPAKTLGLQAMQHAETAAISGVFETRWAVATGEYTLDGNGSLKPVHSSGKPRTLNTLLSNVDSHAVERSDYRYYPNSDISTIDVAALSPIPRELDGTIAAECGPSPITAAAIKALVEQTATKHGVDPAFAVAIVATESEFDRNRNSPKGARGPMQLMPDTATRFAVDDVCDPAANIEGGVRYLRTLLDEFGNPLLAAAAYNAGEHRIYEYGGIPPFPETVSYVAKVVNHQLGLTMPSAGKAKPSRQSAEGTEVGVVAPRKTGSFVAGVMHF